MCSSQTGCTVNSPRVLVNRLSDEELYQYESQYRENRKRNQSLEYREVKKLRLSSAGKMKKKKRKVKLLAVNLSNNDKHLTKIGRLRSNDLRSRLRSRSTIEEGAQHTVGKKSQGISKRKILNQTKSPIKKYNNNTKNHYNETARIRGSKKKTDTKQNVNDPKQSKSKSLLKRCSNNKKETMSRESKSLTTSSFIRSSSNGNKSDYDTDDDLTVTHEVSDIISRLFSISIKKEKDTDTKKPELKMTEKIATLIEENKTLTIKCNSQQFPKETQKPLKLSEKKNVQNDDSKQCKSIEFQSKGEEVKSSGYIKVKPLQSLQSLGIVDKNGSDVIDCSKKSKILDHLIIDDSVVGQFSLLYRQYFNEFIKPLIYDLTKLLEEMLMELAIIYKFTDFMQNISHRNDELDNFSCVERLVDNVLAQNTIEDSVDLGDFTCESILNGNTLDKSLLKENIGFDDLPVIDNNVIDSAFQQLSTKQNFELNKLTGDSITEKIDRPTIHKSIKLSENKILIQTVLEHLTKNMNELDREEVESTVKNYSKDFVLTFTKIIDKFEKNDKKKMIPFVYLYVIKHFDDSSLIKRECVWNIILKLFKIENFSCKYDEVCFKPVSFKEMKTVFSIYERWHIYDSCSKHDASGELINTKYHVNSEDTIQVDSDFLTKTKSSPNKNSVLFDSLSSEMILLSNTSQAHEGLAKDLDSGKNDSVEESREIYKRKCDFEIQAEENLYKENELSIFNNKKKEATISRIFELQINDFEKDCTNDLCEKKMVVPCFYCKNLVSCQDLCQVKEDQIFSAISSEKKILSLVSCNLHKNIIENYIFDEKSDYLLDCVNSLCTRKLSVPCVYCMELIACQDLCQVDEDQYVSNIETEECTFKLISCKAHKDVARNCDEVNEFEENNILPYEPFCWHPNCTNKPLIVCVCKTRSYCSNTCQEEDWFSVHYKDCIRRPHPDLIL